MGVRVDYSKITLISLTLAFTLFKLFNKVMACSNVSWRLARKCRRMFLSEGWIKMMSTLYHLPRSRIISTKGLLSK